ncbi:hypothetical protein TAL182_CH01025 [Rhizobium sp. TAL182]|nr:hypothetical protein TAL182_CH01025 [Rhizobium sp. TAL182]
MFTPCCKSGSDQGVQRLYTMGGQSSTGSQAWQRCGRRPAQQRLPLIRSLKGRARHHACMASPG